MADNRKYYYLKLKESYFDDDAIVLLESMQDGVIYSNILLKLYLKSLKNGGKLQLDENIPYTAQMIATITRQQVGTVERALKIFMKLGLVEPLPSGALYMSNIELLIGQSSTEGERKRRARLALQEQKALPQTGADKCPPYRADICPPEIEIEKEIDTNKDIELKKDIELEQEKEERFVDVVEANFGRGLVKFEYDMINDYLINKHVSRELFLEAVKVAVANNVRKFNYIGRVLDNWLNEGIQTVEQAYQAQREFKAKKANRYQNNQQPSKSNVPDWVDEEYKHEATADEQAQLDALKAAMLED